MPDRLLLGAGFSRNWGGWLAIEAFEHLLGCPEVVHDNGLRQLLWKHQNQGGFEAAIAELQLAYSQNKQAGGPPLMALQSAVMRMLADMNHAFMTAPDWQFGQQDLEHQIGTFLTRFDAIFTLNQDVLLEHHYVNDNINLIGKKKHAGAEYLRPRYRRIQQGDEVLRGVINSACFIYGRYRTSLSDGYKE